MRRKSLRALAIASALSMSAVLSSAAHASVSFDPNTGLGFIGKGDVQTLLGWNNNQLQNNAGSLTFSYKQHERYAVTCTVSATRAKTFTDNVNTNALYYNVARVKNQISGFTLTGFTTNHVAPAPSVNDSCTFAGQSGSITSVDLVAFDSKLVMTYGGTEYIFW